ncbi:MAG: hypothetical protein AB4041_06140 [Microcystaceae cyanobacterium]
MSNRKALIINLIPYDDPTLSNLNPLTDQVDGLAFLLSQYGGFNITSVGWVEEGNPTHKPNGKGNLTHKINDTNRVSLAQLESELINLLQPKNNLIPDTVLIYFRGYGLCKQQGRNESFLATSDVDLAKHFYGLSLLWLRDLLEDSKVKNQVIWFDCYCVDKAINILEVDPKDSKNRSIVMSSGFRVQGSGLSSSQKERINLSDNKGGLVNILLAALNPVRYAGKVIDNYDLARVINDELKDDVEKPYFSNSGKPMILRENHKEDVNAVTITLQQQQIDYLKTIIQWVTHQTINIDNKNINQNNSNGGDNIANDKIINNNSPQDNIEMGVGANLTPLQEIKEGLGVSLTPLQKGRDTIGNRCPYKGLSFLQKKMRLIFLAEIR